MKDDLIAIVEAVRLARLELQCSRDPNCRASDSWTLRRLSQLLESQEMDEAMQARAGRREPVHRRRSRAPGPARALSVAYPINGGEGHAKSLTPSSGRSPNSEGPQHRECCVPTHGVRRRPSDKASAAWPSG